MVQANNAHRLTVLLADEHEDWARTVRGLLAPQGVQTVAARTGREALRLIESGQPLVGPLPSEIAVSTGPIGRLAPAVPPPPGFTVQLPYESRLTVSGRPCGWLRCDRYYRL